MLLLIKFGHFFRAESPSIFLLNFLMNLEELHVYWQSIIDSIEALENEELKASGANEEVAGESPGSEGNFNHQFNPAVH